MGAFRPNEKEVEALSLFYNRFCDLFDEIVNESKLMFEFLLTIFSTRELAIMFWLIIGLILGFCNKKIRKSISDFFVNIMPMLFCKKFCKGYAIFFSWLFLAIYLLNFIGVWDFSMSKDTIFWVLFVEFPTFANAITKAKDERFFKKIIKDNLSWTVFITFLFEFYTFSFFVELIAFPILLILGICYALSQKNKQYELIRKTIDKVFVFLGLAIIYHIVKNVSLNHNMLLEIATLKTYFLPIILTLICLPMVFLLALVCGYEEIFIRLKGENKEKRKMKWKIIKFSNLNLAKLSALRRNLVNVIFCSLTASELKENLLKFQNILNMKVGENYMKRAKFYKVCSAIGIIIFSLGLYLVNSNFNISLLVELVKSLWISNIKSVLSLIFSLGLIFALFALFWSLGNEKKKYEELNYVKKFALSKLLIAIQRQKKLITEYIDLENRNELFYQYIVPICEISVEATKVIASYENLLSSWEKEMLSQLEFSAIRCINDFDINADELVKLNADEFEELFNNKKRTAPQKDDFNYFLSELKSDLEKYKEKHAEAIIEFHGLFE